MDIAFSASDLVIRLLINAIVKGELKPGDKLPSTENLAKQAGTSILSAREAVKNLATIGILEISHGRGIFLTEGAPVIEELLEARKVLESYNAMVAAKTISQSQLQEIENILKEMDLTVKAGDTESFSEKDFEFHLAIGKASGNRILFKTLLNIRNLLRYQLFTVNRLPNIINRSCSHHWEIYDAIQRNDPESAQRHMWQHISDTIEAWKKDVAPLHQANRVNDTAIDLPQKINSELSI